MISPEQNLSFFHPEVVFVQNQKNPDSITDKKFFPAFSKGFLFIEKILMKNIILNQYNSPALPFAGNGGKNNPAGYILPAKPTGIFIRRQNYDEQYNQYTEG